MIEIESQVRKWGNSLGVVIPKEIVGRIGLKPEIRIKLIIESLHTTRVRDIFGKLQFRESTGKILRKADKTLDIGF